MHEAIPPQAAAPTSALAPRPLVSGVLNPRGARRPNRSLSSLTSAAAADSLERDLCARSPRQRGWHPKGDRFTGPITDGQFWSDRADPHTHRQGGVTRQTT